MTKTGTERKIKCYKGYVIAFAEGEEIKWRMYTKDEWDYGKGLRSFEWEADSMREIMDFIDNY